MAKRKTRAQLEAELQLLQNSRWSDVVMQGLLSAIRWGGLGWIAWQAQVAISNLAGKTTLADIGVGFLADVQVSVVLSWVVGGAGIMYGRSQRKLRRDTVERLQARNQELEKLLDPNRSSSQLTARGETRPEDMP